MAEAPEARRLDDAVEFKGGYSSVERDAVAYLFEPKADDCWPVRSNAATNPCASTR
jgi:hypothetical protein